MKCPRCGEPIIEGAAFCWACEAPLDKLVLPSAPPSQPHSQNSSETASTSQEGKIQQILALAVFMMGVLWSCAATAASKNPGLAQYVWPIVLMVVGVSIYMRGKVKKRGTPSAVSSAHGKEEAEKRNR